MTNTGGNVGDKVAIGFFAFGVAVAMTVWFNWISASDDHMLAVADCMVKTQKAHNIGPQEAWVSCEREAR